MSANKKEEIEVTIGAIRMKDVCIMLTVHTIIKAALF
jgi:hypothetical protein